MDIARTVRRAALVLAVAAVVAGCASPEESGAPQDLSTDRDRDGIPDDANNASAGGNGTNATLPGIDLPEDDVGGNAYLP